MFEFPVVFVDIETTGGSPRNSRVIEVAAMRYEQGRVVQQFSSFVNPGTHVPETITRITGIRTDDVADAPTFDDIADELLELCEGAVFIAHNVRFDYSFLRAEFERIGSAFSPKLLCTVRLSRALYPSAPRHSLESIIHRHAIQTAQRHRALADTQAIVDFAQIAYTENGHEAFTAAINRQLHSQFIPPHIDEKHIASLPETPGVYIFRDEQHAPLYIGKSIHLRSRVMSHFRDQSSKEVKIAQHTHHIDTINTSSELAALILESQLIKEMKPLYNRLLRRTKRYSILLRSPTSEYATVSLQTGTLSETSALDAVYGVYENKTKAKKRIDDITRTFNLCPKLMGLEKTNRACFSHTLGKCYGACVGKEAADDYNRRFETALERARLESWPYQSAIAIPTNDRGDGVVIDNWIVKGFYTHNDPESLDSYRHTFNVDEYKILRRFIRENTDAIIPLSRQATLF